MSSVLWFGTSTLCNLGKHMQVEKGKVMDNNPVESFAVVILSKWYVFHVNFREQKHTHTHIFLLLLSTIKQNNSKDT